MNDKLVDPKLAEQIMADGIALRKLEEWRAENPKFRVWRIDSPAFSINLVVILDDVARNTQGSGPTLPAAAAAALKAWEGEA